MEEDDYQGGSQLPSQGGRGDFAWAAMSEEDKKVNTNKFINFMLERDADKVHAYPSSLSSSLFFRCSAAEKPPRWQIPECFLRAAFPSRSGVLPMFAKANIPLPQPSNSDAGQEVRHHRPVQEDGRGRKGAAVICRLPDH